MTRLTQHVMGVPQRVRGMSQNVLNVSQNSSKWKVVQLLV